MIQSYLKKIQHSPKGYRIANTVFFFISGFGYSSWASRIPAIKAQLHLSEAQFGAVLFAFPVGLMLTMPFTGRLLNKYSSRYCMLLGAILFNIVLALPGFAAFVWQLVIILLIFGSSRNILNLSMNAQALEVQKLYPKSIMTTFHAVWSLAGFIGAGLGYVMVTQKIAPSFHLLGVSVAMMAVTAWVYPQTIHTEPVKEKKKFFSMPDKNLIKFAIICFVSMACENTMYDWSGIYFQNILHASPKWTTAAFVFFMTAVTLGRLLGDYAVFKYGIKPILFYSGIFISSGFLICFLFPFISTTIIGYFLIGIGVSCVVPLVFSIAGKSKSLSNGSALTSISTIGYLGFLIVPPMVGFISQISSMKWAFLIMALLGIIMIFMVNKIATEEA
ncbi:MFS transporter [Flavobacterium sp. WC2409]|uniref:MFS transporter n=1 Tax=Flavobacterium sp. WC2409 TaxID=3234139 RepID=A0AB39VZP3_9FLAO